jgi:hypothetical protein
MQWVKAANQWHKTDGVRSVPAPGPFDPTAPRRPATLTTACGVPATGVVFPVNDPAIIDPCPVCATCAKEFI